MNDGPTFQKGDRVCHPDFGTGEIFELSLPLKYADINLDTEFVDNRGRKRTSVIVPLSELKKIEE